MDETQVKNAGKWAQTIAKAVIDIAGQIGVKVTLGSGEIAKWAADNPVAAAAMAKAASNLVAGIKGVKWAGLLQAIGQARESGASMSKIMKGLVSGAWKSAGGTKALGIGALKIAALAAAVAFARETVKHAGKAWDAKTDMIVSGWKSGDAGKVAKGLWELNWETYIPVLTYRQLSAFFRHWGKWGQGTKEEEAAKAILKYVGTVDSNAQVGVQDQGEVTLQNAERQSAENSVAKELGMVKAPDENTPAYREWQKNLEQRSKEVINNMSGSNDPKWYLKGKFNTFTHTGSYNWDTYNGDPDQSPYPSDGNTTPKRMGMPTVAALYVRLTIGKAYNDLMDTTFTSITDNIKALNQNASFTTGWSKFDVINFIHTIRLAYAAWLQGCRAYKLVNEYWGSDLTTPYAFFAAMGLDYDSFQANRAQIKEDLDTLESRLSVINFEVSNLDLIARTRQLFMNGFRDAKSPKGQVTFVTPIDSYYVNPTTGASVTFQCSDKTALNTATTGMTYATWLSNIRTIIDVLVDTPKYKNMLTCFRRVLGTSESIFKVPVANEKFEFKFDKEMLMQIENADIDPANSSSCTGTVNANDGSLDSLTETINIGTVIRPKYINSHAGKLNKEMALTVCRLQFVKFDSTHAYWGTEVPFHYSIYVTYSTSTNVRKLVALDFFSNSTLNLYSSSSFSATDRTNMWERLQKISLLSTFDWSPQIRFSITVGSTTATAGSLTFNNYEVNTDWEDWTESYTTSIDSSKVFLHNMKNANYSLWSYLQTRVDFLIDHADTAATKAAKNVKFSSK